MWRSSGELGEVFWALNWEKERISPNLGELYSMPCSAYLFLKKVYWVLTLDYCVSNSEVGDPTKRSLHRDANETGYKENHAVFQFDFKLESAVWFQIQFQVNVSDFKIFQ